MDALLNPLTTVFKLYGVINPVFIDSILFMSRTFVAFVLTKMINDRFQSFVPNHKEHGVTYPKYGLLKLFFFSAVLMGFPFIALSQKYESFVLLGNSLFVVLLVFDIVRMYILTVYAPNAILIGQSKRLFLKVWAIPIVGLIAYIITFRDELEIISTIWRFTGPPWSEIRW
jgi:hypothetical protein